MAIEFELLEFKMEGMEVVPDETGEMGKSDIIHAANAKNCHKL